MPGQAAGLPEGGAGGAGSGEGGHGQGAAGGGGQGAAPPGADCEGPQGYPDLQPGHGAQPQEGGGCLQQGQVGEEVTEVEEVKKVMAGEGLSGVVKRNFVRKHIKLSILQSCRMQKRCLC